MNILPTHPKYVGARYFADMQRLHCDVAYTAFYAQSREEVFGPLAEGYKKFVAMAHDRGIPACIQLQSTLANLGDLSLEEAQHSVDNTPHTFRAPNVSGEWVCFASFASEAWKQLLRDFTAFFVQECGFDWVVYEEPMYAVDIPGTRDRFYAEFQRRHPGTEYPTRNEETPAYLKVQLLKKDVLTGFYGDLLEHARRVGAARRGIMPWFFVPIYENTPYETLDTSCDLGRIIHLPDLDFVVVRMQPDNIYSGATDVVPSRVGPRLYYTEVLAHSLGKPVICVNNAVNEHREWYGFDAIPFDYFRAATLSAVAAAPEGMSHHWYVPRDLPHIQPHLDFLAQTNDALGRLGQPECAVAFVYSARGAIHSWPYRNPQLHERFWSFAEQMLFEPGPLYPVGDRTVHAGNIPFKIFYADTLAECLEHNPETRLLVLDEYYPLTPDETARLRSWLEAATADAPRAILVFASGFGYSADPDIAGDVGWDRAWPALMTLCGFDPSSAARPRILNRGRTIRAVSARRCPRPWADAFSAYVYRNLDAALCPGTEVLYENEREKLPYLTRARVGEHGAAFTLCAGLWPRTLPPLAPLVRELLKSIGVRLPDIHPGPGVLWNLTRKGFLIATNPTAEPTYVDIADTAARYWNVVAEKFLDTTRLELPAYGFALLRRLRDGQRIVDLRNASLVELDDTPGAEQTRICFSAAAREVELVLTAFPATIQYTERFGNPSADNSATFHPPAAPGNDAVYMVRLSGPPGPREIILHWIKRPEIREDDPNKERINVPWKSRGDGKKSGGAVRKKTSRRE